MGAAISAKVEQNNYISWKESVPCYKNEIIFFNRT